MNMKFKIDTFVREVQCLGIVPYPFVPKIVVTIPGTKKQLLFNLLPSPKSLKNVNLIVCKLKNYKNYQLNPFCFQPQESSKHGSIFCKLQKLIKQESYFLQATKSKNYEFDFFFFKIEKPQKACI